MKLPVSSRKLLFAAIAGAWCFAALAQTALPGADVEGLLAIARDNNPEYAGMRLEAEAAAQRIEPAGALPDPKLRTELMDITKGGAQSPSLSPSRVGSTRYTLMQDIPWFGKRDLKREIAELEAESARGRAMGTWADVSARIKTTYAQQYFLARNERLTREILDLISRLEKIAQARYAGGLAAQQDVIRAQVEQTSMRNELIALETERHHMHTRMNALLARPANAPLSEPEKLRPIPALAKLDYVTLEDRARARNPLLSADESRLKSAEKNRELAYKNRYPDFTFGVVPNQMQNSVKQWDLMVEMNIPLQQGTRRAQERESEAMLAAARSRREATSNQVLSDLSENIAGLDAARRTEALASESLLPQSELTFKSALAGYENGKVDFATLLDAQRQIRQAKQNQIKAQAEGQARLAEIERILGEDL
uniref:Outer membrane efflux protein n=1 Tax=Dechloromonas aromatica (strain RCB) TaxID=159087 RepID=Q47DT1_DECAR